MDFSNSDLEGLYKTVYSDDVCADAISEFDIYHSTFKRTDKYKLGKDFQVPVQLTREGGGTSNATNPGPYDLNAARSRQTPPAVVSSCTFTQRSLLGYEEVSAALSGKTGRNKVAAFIDVSKDTTMNQIATSNYRAEVMYRWGCGTAADDSDGAIDNLGQVATTSQVQSGEYKLFMDPGSWCTAFFENNEEWLFDVRSSAGAQRLTAFGTLKSVDPENYAIVLTGDNGELATIVDGDHIYFAGSDVSGYENEMVGLGKQLANAGSLFGIDASVFSGWRSKVVDAEGNPLSMALLHKATGRLAARGFRGELTAMVHPDSWLDVMRDEADFVRFTGGAQNVYERGSSHIRFKSQVGVTTLISDPLQKRGETWLLPKDRIMRLGSNEGTFDLKGAGRMVVQSADKSGFETRYFWSKCILNKAPALSVRIKNIAPQVTGG